MPTSRELPWRSLFWSAFFHGRDTFSIRVCYDAWLFTTLFDYDCDIGECAQCVMRFCMLSELMYALDSLHMNMPSHRKT